MWKADLRWMKSDYAYFDNAVPKLKPNAPKWSLIVIIITWNN